MDAAPDKYVHIAAGVDMAAERVVEHMHQRLGAAAGIARPGGAVLLDAGIAAGGINHAAQPGVILKAAAHLLVVDDGIQVVHLVIVHAVAPFAVGVVDNLVDPSSLKQRAPWSTNFFRCSNHASPAVYFVRGRVPGRERGVLFKVIGVVLFGLPPLCARAAGALLKARVIIQHSHRLSLKPCLSSAPKKV